MGSRNGLVKCRLKMIAKAFNLKQGPEMKRLHLVLVVFVASLSFAAIASADHKVALVQYDSSRHFGDYEHNMSQLRAYADEAVENEASLIVFPEGAIYGYASDEELWCKPNQQACAQKRCRNIDTVAEAIPAGKTSQAWITFAQEHNTYVNFNIPEKVGSRYFNTSVVVGPHGLVGKYQKRALYYVDSCYAEAGSTETIVTLPFGKFGMMICADGNQDSYFRSYASQTADGILLQMDWDQAPDGSSRDAAIFFQNAARRHKVDIFASDNSKSDGTGMYNHRRSKRQRDGLSEPAVGEDGLSWGQSLP